MERAGMYAVYSDLTQKHLNNRKGAERSSQHQPHPVLQLEFSAILADCTWNSFWNGAAVDHGQRRRGWSVWALDHAFQIGVRVWSRRSHVWGQSDLRSVCSKVLTRNARYSVESRAEPGFFPNPVFQRNALCLSLIWLTSWVPRQSTTTQYASTWTKSFCFPFFLMWQGETQSPFPSCSSCSQSTQGGPTLKLVLHHSVRCWVKHSSLASSWQRPGGHPWLPNRLCVLFPLLGKSRSPLWDLHPHYFVLSARGEGLSSLWAISTDHAAVKPL